MRRRRTVVLAAALIALANCSGPSADQVGSAQRACAAAPTATWQQPTASVSRSLARDPTGGLFVLAGDAQSTLTRLDDAGQTLWIAPVDGSPGAIFAASGDVLAATGIRGMEAIDPQIRVGGQPRSQALITRLDVRGEMIWTAAVSDAVGDLFPSFVSTGADGDVVVGGRFLPDVPSSEYPNPPFVEGGFVARLSSTGRLLWERHFVNPGRVRGFVQDSHRRVGVIFWLDQAAAIDDVRMQPKDPGYAGFLVWFDETGAAVGAYDVTEDPSQRFTGVVRAADGRFYVTGFVIRDGPAYTSMFFITGFSSAGERLWTRRLSLGPQNDDGNVTVDECGDVLFIGNGSGIIAARMTRDGEIKTQLVVPTSLADYVVNLAPAPGGIFLVGARDNHQTCIVARLGL